NLVPCKEARSILDRGRTKVVRTNVVPNQRPYLCRVRVPTSRLLSCAFDLTSPHIGSSQPKRSAPSEAFKARSFFDCGSRWISRRVRRGVSRRHLIFPGRRDEKARPRYCANRAKGF